MLDGLKIPDDIQTYPLDISDRMRLPKGRPATMVTSIAYDLLTIPDKEHVASTYSMTMGELADQIKNNAHLRQAIGELKTYLDNNGAFETAVLAVASEGLPALLSDIRDPETGASTRARTMSNLMTFLTQRERNRTDQRKIDAQGTGGNGPALNVSFQVQSPVRGITMDANTLEAQPNE